MKGKVIFFCLGMFLSLSFAMAYTCSGSEVDWIFSKPGSCSVVGSCAGKFASPEAKENAGTINLIKCSSQVSSSFYVSTFSEGFYALSFSWDGEVYDNSCNNATDSVLKVEVTDVSSGTALESFIGECTGTICSTYSGYQSKTISFQATGSNTSIKFSVISSSPAIVNVKTLTLTGDIPCQTSCGGDSSCEGKMPGLSYSTCSLGDSYFSDSCDSNCELKESSTTCRSPSFDSTCSADELCNGINPTSCINDSYVCSSSCSVEDRDLSQEFCDNRKCSRAYWINNECCGDDVNETQITCKWSGRTCTGSSCCSSETDCSWENACYSDNSTIVNSELPCGTILRCNNTRWYEEQSIPSCNDCGEWVSSVGLCCGDSRSFSFTEGACFEGIVHLCSDDDLCARIAGAECVNEDNDCNGALLNISLATERFKTNENFLFNIRLVNMEDSSNFDLTYSLYNSIGGFVLGDSVLKTDVEGINYYPVTLDISELKPGIYTLTVESSFNGAALYDEQNVSFLGDCVNIGGVEQVLTVPNENQDVFFTLENLCKIKVESLNFSFAGSMYSIDSLIDSVNFTLTNISFGTSSRNEYAIVDYDSGSSKELIEIKMSTEADIETELSQLINSTSFLLESAYGSVKYAFLSAKDAKSNYESAAIFLNLSISEFSEQNYGSSKWFALESATLSVLAKKEAKDSLFIELGAVLVIVLSVLTVAILQIKRYYTKKLENVRIERY